MTGHFSKYVVSLYSCSGPNLSQCKPSYIFNSDKVAESASTNPRTLLPSQTTISADVLANSAPGKPWHHTPGPQKAHVNFCCCSYLCIKLCTGRKQWDCSILRGLFHLEVISLISELVSELSQSELQASKHKQELLQVQGPLFALQSLWESKCMEGLLQGLEFPQSVLVLLELTMLLVPLALQHPVLTWLQLHLGVSHWFVGAKLLPTQLLSTFSAISMCHEISFMVWNVFQCLPMEDLPYVWQGISIPNLLMGQEQKKEQSLAEGGFAMLASKMMLLDQELQEMPAKRTSRFWLPRTGCAHFQLWCKENCKWDLSILPLYVNNIGQSKMLMAGMASGPTECRTISFTNGLKPEGSSRLKSTWKGT